MVCIVLGEDSRNRHTLLCQNPYRISIGIAPGSIRGAIGSVASHADDTDIGKPRNPGSSCQRQLLIPSAQTVSNQMNNGLPSGDVR